VDLVMRSGLVCAVVSAIGLLCASSAHAEDHAWYDVKPLLASLRPAVLAEISARPPNGSPESVPLYDLDLRVQPESGTFTVAETVYFTNQGAQPVRDLVVHVDANAGRAQSQELVRIVDGACVEQACVMRRISPATWRFLLARPLRAQERVRLIVHLRGRAESIAADRTTLLGQSLEGLSAFSGKAQTSFGELAVGDGIFSLANFYAVLAPRRAEKWQIAEANTLGDLGSDEIANVRAVVSVPADSVVAHVGTVSETTTVLNADGPGHHRKQLKIVAGLVRDFTLVVAESFEVLSRAVNGVEVRSFFRSSERRSGEQVLNVASAALQDFEQRFGKYPYTRLDVAEAPLVGGAGGVEFSGLATIASVFYKESGALGGALAQAFPALSGADMAGAMREFVTAHEVAHQWWHVLVGSDSQRDPFADEGLAQYSTLLYFEDRYGAARAEHEAELNLKLPYQMMRLVGQPDAAVDRPVQSFPTPVAYAGLVYGKGPFFFRELRRLVGDETFFARLRQYRDRFSFQIAPAHELVDVFSGSQPGVVQLLARHWLDESHGDEDLGKFELSGLLSNSAPGGGSSKSLETSALPDKLRQLLDGAGL
jgi:hypothetical protein